MRIFARADQALVHNFYVIYLMYSITLFEVLYLAVERLTETQTHTERHMHTHTHTHAKTYTHIHTQR